MEALKEALASCHMRQAAGALAVFSANLTGAPCGGVLPEFKGPTRHKAFSVNVADVVDCRLRNMSEEDLGALHPRVLGLGGEPGRREDMLAACHELRSLFDGRIPPCAKASYRGLVDPLHGVRR